METKTREVLDELILLGLINSDIDLTSGLKTGRIFDFMVQNYSYLLDIDPEIVLPDRIFEDNLFYYLSKTFGPLFLSSPHKILEKEKLIFGHEEMFPKRDNIQLSKNEPVIFVSNHYFKDDVTTSILAADRRCFTVFASLPHFFGTIDGFMLARNGVLLANRKVEESKSALVDKGKYVLSKGHSIMIKPEGVWHKNSNGCMLDFYSGFYRMVKKEDGSFYPIVPIIHYINNTYEKGKNNPIYTIVADPIYLDGMNQKDGIDYVRTVMLTWFYRLMESYGRTTREEILGNHENSTEAWEDELKKRVATAPFYDLSIETTADNNRKYKDQNPIEIWNQVAKEFDLILDKQHYTSQDLKNAGNLYQINKLVKELKRNDFQHRF